MVDEHSTLNRQVGGSIPPASTIAITPGKWRRTALDSAQFCRRLNKAPDVAVVVSEGLQARGRIIRGLRHVIGHEHVLVADLSVDLEYLDKVDAAVVGIGLYKSSRCPRILRKWTLKILSRVPK